MMFKIEYPQDLINEYVQAKQHLLPRYKSDNLEEMINDIVGLSGHSSKTIILSCLARINISSTPKSCLIMKDFVKVCAMREKKFIFTKNFFQIIKNIYIEKNNLLENMTKLVIAYMYAYGPVSLEDIIWWTGFSKIETDKILKSIKDNIIAIAIKDLPHNYYMLKIDYEQMLNFKPDKNFGVNLLPTQDNYITGYLYRDRFLLALKDRGEIFNKKNASKPVILINGKIYGTWEIKNKKIKIDYFVTPQKDVFNIIEKEIDRMENEITMGLLPNLDLR